MASFERSKLDSKGRLLIPQAFREIMRLKEGSQVSLALDEKSGRITVAASMEKNLLLIEIGLPDAPGSLAKAASALAKNGVDLISSESRSTLRGQDAQWSVLCNASSVKSLPALKAELLSAGASFVRFHWR